MRQGLPFCRPALGTVKTLTFFADREGMAGPLIADLRFIFAGIQNPGAGMYIVMSRVLRTDHGDAVGGNSHPFCIKTPDHPKRGEPEKQGGKLPWLPPRGDGHAPYGRFRRAGVDIRRESGAI